MSEGQDVASRQRPQEPKDAPRRAGIGDARSLFNLDRAIFGPQVFSLGGWHEEIRAAHVFLARYDAREAGFISVARAGDEIEVRKIGVLPEYRRKGIAAGLLRHAIGQVAAAPRVLIDVAADNFAGIGLYKRLGFIEIARRRKYYSHGADAIVMRAEAAAIEKIMSALPRK